MTSKQKKTSSNQSAPKAKSNNKGLHQPNAWLMSGVYAVLGCLAYYYLQPILAFRTSDSAQMRMAMTVISGAAALLGSTGFFRREAGKVALWSIPIIGIQLLANILLTYQWVDPAGMWLFFANTITIPLGILWYFILRSRSVDEEVESTSASWSIPAVFNTTLSRVVGILILLVSCVLIFYRLGYYDIWEDENLVINAAKGVYEQGVAYFKDGYDRAWIHTLLCAGVFEVFGVSEFTGRIPSAIFGIVFVLVCFYVFARWYGLAWLALLIPLICLMNDRFLILFRYMRMYALLIPLFLLGVYLLYRAIEWIQKSSFNAEPSKSSYRPWLQVAIALLFIPLLAHIHKLSMILLPAFGLFVLYIVLLHRSRNQLRLLWISLAGGVVLLMLTFVVQLDALKMFRQVAEKIMVPHNPMTAYFEYVFKNGLPLNSTFMFLLAGLGLLGAKISRRYKSLLILNYLFIVIAVISMVYLIGNEGRDYRYVAHIVPFVVCTLLVTIYFAGRVVAKGSYPWTMILVLLIASIQLIYDYEKVYVRHPWAPRYSIVYDALKSQYKADDALFATNIKSYYLDPKALAGPHYHKVPKRKEYTMEQFEADIRAEGRGWFLWELHKSHHLRQEIIQYIYKNFKPIHNSNLDDLGVELFYFDETMIR